MEVEVSQAVLPPPPITSKFQFSLHDLQLAVLLVTRVFLNISVKTIGILLLYGLPLYSIYLGHENRYNCSAEPFLPIFLFTFSFFVLIRTTVFFIGFLVLKKFIPFPWYVMICTQCSFDLFTILVVLLNGLLGLFWLLGMGLPDFKNKLSLRYCDHRTYFMSAIVVIVCLFVNLIWIIGYCCFSVQLDMIEGEGYFDEDGKRRVVDEECAWYVENEEKEKQIEQENREAEQIVDAQEEYEDVEEEEVQEDVNIKSSVINIENS